jgi:sugar phosphate isomerase/epimerase
MNSLRFALSYASYYGRTFEDFVREARALGFSIVELIPDQSPNLYNEFDFHRTTELKALLTELEMECTAHNVFYDINLLSLVPSVKENSFSITESVVDWSTQIGALTLTVHPGYMFPGWRRDMVQRERFWIEAKDSFVRLGSLSNALPVLIENGSYHLCTRFGEGRKPLHVGIDPEELDRLIDLSEGKLGICLDLGKAIQSGHEVEEFVRKRPTFIKQLQLSSIDENIETISKLINTLGENNFSGVIVLEGQLPDVTSGLEKLQKIGLFL